MVRLEFAGSFGGRELDVLRPKVGAALEFFPEIATRNVLKIGRIRPGGGLLGQAVFSSMQIRLVPGASMHTIGHEFMHLAAQLGRPLPKSEVAMDVFTVALNDVFNDDFCTYVLHGEYLWTHDRNEFRDLMVYGVELYRRHGKYKWYRLLRKELERARNGIGQQRSFLFETGVGNFV